jgi:alginate O-acetyltransferase complex protein AlgI
MLFNSTDFAVFFIVVFFMYWFVANQNLKIQNLLIVISSYFFYGWWDWRFLSLILLSTILDYVVGNLLGNEFNPKKRKIFLWISVLINLGILVVFKYFNFFLDSLNEFLPGLRASVGFNTLQVILPVGISFYTFQTLSYTIDIYKRKLNPTKDFLAFAAFVCFFPQLVAGPIERASNLLPQFLNKRKFDYVQGLDGLKQILWGLFKKIVIADNCARYVNLIFGSPQDFNGSTLLLGAVFFSFQIYGDFSGYSDIAIGTAKLFNFNLGQNFSYPYFSRNLAEFWRRWHISLSTWFRDYLYIPLGGNRGNITLKIRNILIIFVVSGLWHGANWTFIIWGLIHAICFIPLFLSSRNRIFTGKIIDGKSFPNIKCYHIFFTFMIITLSWVFFRADNLHHAFVYLSGILSKSLFTWPEFFKMDGEMLIIFLIIFFLIIEWLGKEYNFAIAHVKVKKRAFRYAFYYTLIALIFWFGGSEEDFIYFQF